MPIPAMTLVTSGKHAAGKQNLIKEVLVLPKPGVSMDKVEYYITLRCVAVRLLKPGAPRYIG